jgi:hypothetical protein
VVIKSSKEQDPRGEHLRNALYKAYRDYRAKHHTSAIHITINIDAQGVI